MLTLSRVWLLLASVYLFAPAEAALDGTTLVIQPIGVVEALETAIPVVVTVTHEPAAAVARGTITLEVIDTWRIVGAATQAFEARRGEAAEVRFTCIAGAGSHAARYPIRARATFDGGSGSRSLDAVLVVEVAREAVAEAAASATSAPLLVLSGPGRLELDLSAAWTSFRQGSDGEVVQQLVGWTGVDPVTSAAASPTTVTRGDTRESLSFHPPWRQGWGSVWSEWLVSLPNVGPITFDSATAIRDHIPGVEPASDGVQFEVWVAVEPDVEFKPVWTRFSDAKRWELARVDLTEYAGQRVRLRLLTNPGPAHNTTCDTAFWAGPALIAGVEPTDERPTNHAGARAVEAVAIDALQGAMQDPRQTDETAITLRMSAAAVVALQLGPHGIADGLISFAIGAGTVTYEGFRVEIDGRRVGDWRSGFTYGSLRIEGAEWSLPVRDGAQDFVLRTRVWTESGGLRLRFSLSGVEPDARGRPRITHVSLGPVNRAVRRVYAGHGNVLEDPGPFRLTYNGFKLSTSFVGFDFDNGLSIVQATNIPPDALEHDPENGIATLVGRHDVTWTLVPSADGAFDAARQYRRVANLSRPDSLSDIQGRMCLDQWGGDYGRAADDIRRAARYGMAHAVFVKHVWQRWGYDYRLPDIYPPSGDLSDFAAMVEACKDAGILFAAHDNYIDFYPDAAGFSYKHIVFNEDGTPQRAWTNSYRDAQSYRWLSHSFQPWMDANLIRMRDGFAPTSYFVDVFSAITPRDYYDEAGRFYPKTESVRRWGEAFDLARERFDGAPMISEAGHDALVGHLDAAQADHMAWAPADTASAGPWSWNVPARDGERIPWHDMVTHGNFVLFAGGLGNRYQGTGSRELHGYGSDDYLSMTALGGRNPMCDGPFNRSAVMTYWLLHDVCDDLARREMTDHRFADDDIHRQVVGFEAGAEVFVNRGETEWVVKGHQLPTYGFYAESGQHRAAVERIEGTVAAWAEGPEASFFDARPPEQFGGVPIHAEVVDAKMTHGRQFRLRLRWTVDSPVREPGKAFLHFTNADVAPDGEHIAFQGSVRFTAEQWGRAGEYEVLVEAELPKGAPAGTYGVRVGVYQPDHGGRRLRLQGRRDGSNRQDGGELVFAEHGEGGVSVAHTPPPADDTSERVNSRRAVVDFGPAATNGAFRLLREERLVVPLPDSAAFSVALRLDALGMTTTVSTVTALGEDGSVQQAVPFALGGGTLVFETTPGVFAYRLQE